MKTVADLARARQGARMDRGPWPSQEAIEHGVRECLEEIADAYAFAQVRLVIHDTLRNWPGIPSAEWARQTEKYNHFDNTLWYLNVAFKSVASASPDAVREAFAAAGVELEDEQ